MRTREEQIADIVSCLRFDNSGFATQTLTHLAEKFIEEAEERVKVVPPSSVEPQVLVASHEMTDEQKKLPEWVWLNPDTKEMSFGRWSRVSGNHAPYIRADLCLEAERRAEQRVRAEIGRDAERWRTHIMLLRRSHRHTEQEIQSTIHVIDSAREVKE